MDDETGPDESTKKHRLTYNQVEALEAQGRKLTGSKTENWVDGRTICTTCINAHIIRRYNRNNRTIRCTADGMLKHEDVAECSEYRNMTELSLSQMASMATLIGGIPERKVGFRKE